MKKSVSFHSYICFIALFYLFLFQNLLTDIIPIFSYFDEAVALLAFPLFFIELKNNNFKIIKKKYSWFWLIIIFIAAGFAGNLKYGYQSFLSVAMPSMFLAIKFWLAIYTGSQLFNKLDIQNYASKIFLHVRIIIILFFVLILADNILDIFPAEMRYGFRCTQLFYGHPSSFSAVCVFLIAALMFIHPYITGSFKWCCFVVIFLLTTLRTKSLAATLVFALIYYLIFSRKKKISIRTLLLFLPVILYVGWDQISYYFIELQGRSARYLLISVAITILFNCFPIGTGFGTFASYFSTIKYSPVYKIYGISLIWGLSENMSSFAMDSFWAMILGETGFIGLCAIILVLVFMFRKLQKVMLYDRALYAAGMICLIYILIISTADAAFVHPNTIPLAIILGIVYRKNTEKNIAETNFIH